MCTSPSEVTYASLLDLDSMASRSHRGAVLCPRSTNSSKPVTSISDLCNFKLRLKKPTPQTCSKISRDQNPEIRSPEALPRASVASGKSPTRRHRILTSRSYSRRMRHPIGILVDRSREPKILGLNRAHTRLHAPPEFLASPPCAGRTPTRLTRAEDFRCCHLTSPNDVITPRHQPCQHLHISPSPRQRHVISHVSSVVSSAPRHLADR